MPYYNLIKLPLNEDSFNILKFREEEINSNTMWIVEGTAYFIHTYDNPEYSVMNTLKKQLDIHYKPVRYSEKEFNLLFKHYALQGKIAKVNFPIEDYDNYISESHEQLTSLLYSKSKDHQKIVDLYTEVTEEEYYSPDYFILREELGEHYLDFRIYTTGSITVRLYKSNQVVSNEEIHKLILNIYNEVLLFLNKVEEINIKEIHFEKLEKRTHPLTNAKKVLEILFKEKEEDLSIKLNLSKDEVEYIKNELVKYTLPFEGKEVYDYQSSSEIKEIKKRTL